MSLRIAETRTHVVAIEDGRVTATLGVLSQPGRVGLVFPPELDRPSPDVVGRLIEAALARLARAGAAFAQLTLSPEESELAKSFLPHGFAELTDALVMERPASRGKSGSAADGLTAIRCDPERDSDRLIELISRINEGTLDCPELDVLRTPADLLEAHDSHSRDGRDRWWRYEAEGRDVGVVLGTTAEDSDAAEILFFGVVSDQRGKGHGRRLLEHFVAQASEEGLAARAGMDSRNTYADTIYKACGFSETARLRVWVHPLAAPV